eukprot:TRINITY_DN18093_c0_g1_i3.p1 TRINITY_DN18093_c0_g1~~TRINITY_DN18093_c0_g1_i3.p1  ORF type:complete len:329 (+),score=69.06 TRINITY_DN18093_c0_g1_i3:188-1174(+)
MPMATISQSLPFHHSPSLLRSRLAKLLDSGHAFKVMMPSQGHSLLCACSLTDRASMGVEQTLKAAGVDTNEPRISLVLAISSSVARKTEEVVQSAVTELAKYVNPSRGGAKGAAAPRNLEEALMTVPDLETIPSQVLFQDEGYEVREIKEYMVAETDMAAASSSSRSGGFDFFGSSRAFNTLAGYLFGDNKQRTSMEMTTPVISTRQASSKGLKMEMTTPVLSTQEEGTWRMAFVMPAEFGEEGLPLPNNSSVKLRKVPARTMAVLAFVGIVTDAEVARRERALRSAILRNGRVQVKLGATLEVAQYNPPFTPPFLRRNEVALEVDVV